MTVYYNEQYRPLTTIETAADDGLSVRVQDLMLSINNAKAHAMAPDIINDAWPLAYGGGLVGQVRAATQTNDVLMQFAPVRIPNGYTMLYASCCAKMAAGNSGSCTLRLYLGPAIFRGNMTSVATADLQSMGAHYATMTFTIDSTSSMVEVANVANPIYDGGALHAVLTGQCSDEDEACDVMALSCSLRIYSLT